MRRIVYAIQLEVIDPMIVHRFCKQGVRKDKGFTKNGKSLEELKKEAEEIVEYFLANKSDTHILDNLVMCDIEIEDLLINMGLFYMKWLVRTISSGIILNCMKKYIIINGNITNLIRKVLFLNSNILIIGSPSSGVRSESRWSG